jgi:2-dehydro-3-deoxygalactonokinase
MRHLLLAGVGAMPVEILAVDWGTTNRRLFYIGANGRLLSSDNDDCGILGAHDFPAEVATLKSRADGGQLLLVGMIGSSRGWVEVPYVQAPVQLADVARQLAQPMPDVNIVPGVMFADTVHPDIMRGEEVQLFGAIALGQASSGLFCHPGTHTKWIEVESATITRFRTIMTGDMLAALKAWSILSDILGHAPACDAYFVEGVDHALDNSDLTAELFGAHARVITGQMRPQDAASRISGLLIGTDVRTGLGRGRADVVTLVGTPALCERYAMALRRAGRESLTIDGDAAFVAGAAAMMASPKVSDT